MVSLPVSVSMARFRFRSNISLWRYKLRHWAFQWKQDEEGDIAFVLLGFIAFVKYKEHTIVRCDGRKMADAPKYVGGEQ